MSSRKLIQVTTWGSNKKKELQLGGGGGYVIGLKPNTTPPYLFSSLSRPIIYKGDMPFAKGSFIFKFPDEVVVDV